MGGSVRLLKAVGLDNRFHAKQERRRLKLRAEIGDVENSPLFGVLNCGRAFQCGSAACPVCSERFGTKLVRAVKTSNLFRGRNTSVCLPETDRNRDAANPEEELTQIAGNTRELIAKSDFSDAVVLGVVHGRSSTPEQQQHRPPLRTFLLINRPLDDALETAVGGAMRGSGFMNFMVQRVDPMETLLQIASFFRSPFGSTDEVSIETSMALGVYKPEDRLVLHNAVLTRDADDRLVFSKLGS